MVGPHLDRLDPFVDEGFLDRNGRDWRATDLGRFLVRNVASVLDPYLKREQRLPTFSSSA